jgi:hypothetical protein
MLLSFLHLSGIMMNEYIGDDITEKLHSSVTAHHHNYLHLLSLHTAVSLQVSGIMMNEYTGDDITEKLHEEQWLGQLQETAHGGADRAAGSSSSESSSSSSSSSGSGEISKPEVKEKIASGSSAEQTLDKNKESDRRRKLYAAVFSD